MLPLLVVAIQALDRPARRKKVHVFEANHIGFGGSESQCGVGEWPASPEKIQNILGPIYGDRFIRRFSDGPQYVFDLRERYLEFAASRRRQELARAHSPKGLKDLQARFGQWQRRRTRRFAQRRRNGGYGGL